MQQPAHLSAAGSLFLHGKASRWGLGSSSRCLWALLIGARLSRSLTIVQRACRCPANAIVGGLVLLQNHSAWPSHAIDGFVASLQGEGCGTPFLP